MRGWPGLYSQPEHMSMCGCRMLWGVVLVCACVVECVFGVGWLCGLVGLPVVCVFGLGWLCGLVGLPVVG